MTIGAELQAEILRRYHTDRWRVGTIARQLHVHHSTVTRVLGVGSIPAVSKAVPSRVNGIDPYLPYVLETLAKYPTLTASRLYVMVRALGYRGGPSRFRQIVARHRPRPPAEAFLRLRTLPGEQGQVDWASFGHWEIGRASRPLMAFMMVLSYSRRIFLHFFLNARMDSFLRGHTQAFSAWGGVPRVILSDNLKSAVLERRGDAIRFHPDYLHFAAHHGFEPRPVAIARGNEKGRVERAIRYVRSAFFAAREFRDIADLNAQALQWCEHQAAERPWPQDPRVRVNQAFVDERPYLLRLPEQPYPLGDRQIVAIGKTPYARFDWNDYSLPHTHVRRSVTVLASDARVRILDAGAVLADHVRSYDKGQQIEDPAHIAALVAYKKRAHRHQATDRLAHAVPASADLLTQAAMRGHNLGSIVAALGRLLDQYGPTALQAAILVALSRDVPHPNAVHLALEQAREETHRPPPVAVSLSAQVRARDVSVRTHALSTYDALRPEPDESSEENES